jgi:CDP-2,3-bis-(O-geranylgeranyl)-sn-glycerol synthase
VHPHWSVLLSLLVLILLANGLPALLGLLLGRARPLDGGRTWSDGRPVLGQSKTWRGLFASLLATPLAGLALGIPWYLGLWVALGAMFGDLVASFIKRRLGLRSGESAPVLDQLPESLIPVLLLMGPLGLGWADAGVLVLSFAALDLILTPLARGVLGRRG